MQRIFARSGKIGSKQRYPGRLATGFALLALLGAPAMAQQTTTPGIDSDLATPGGSPPPPPVASPMPGSYPAPAPVAPQPVTAGPASGTQPASSTVDTPPAGICGQPQSPQGGYQSDDLIGEATGVFGSGAHGLADLIRDILKKQGSPDGYIKGREAGGAIAIGLRYGSGTLCQKTMPPLPVYWTGPSIGFDAGANAAKTFVLVYNLTNRNDLFRRYGAGEGQAYFVGGFNISYLRRGDVVLIPVRLGVGLRLGINGGYMKFTRRENWFPF